MIITLIGMPGAGKTCMGRHAANKLGIPFVDADRVIEANDGRKLQTIIDEDGLDAFRALEEKTLLSLNGNPLVISTGGSAVYYPAAMERFRKIGKVVYLYCSLPVILRRIGDFSRRGIVLAPGQTFEDLYREREVLYRRYADITVNCDGTAYSHYHDAVYRVVRDRMIEEGFSVPAEKPRNATRKFCQKK